MKTIIRLVFALCLALLVSISLQAADKATFSTFPIPLMVVDKNHGVFIELTKEIGKRTGMEITIIVTPPKRSIYNFLNKKSEVLFPAVKAFFPPNQPYLKSNELIYVKTDFIFTRKGEVLLRTAKDLEGKRVGITRGYPYARELMNDKKIRFEAAGTDEVNVKKLFANHITAFVVEEKSGIKAFENEKKLDKMQYDPSMPVSKQDVFFAFQKDERGSRLEKLLSGALKEMKQDGTFAEIMKKAQ